MGKSSTAVNHWMRDRGRFADLFNGVVFDGEQVVRPEDLEEARGESDILVPDQEKKERQVQRYRDIVMQWKKAPYLAMLACESQSSVHLLCLSAICSTTAFPTRSRSAGSARATDEKREQGK